MIELRGIIQYQDQGHKHTILVVSVPYQTAFVLHELKVDAEVNRDMILDVLLAKHSVQRGDIVWPSHIAVPGGE